MIVFDLGVIYILYPLLFNGFHCESDIHIHFLSLLLSYISRGGGGGGGGILCEINENNNNIDNGLIIPT